MIKQFNAFLTLNLQFFAAEGEQEGSETNPDGQPPAETQVKSSESAEKTFTQAQLDELIAKRIARVEKKYEGFDDLKAKLATFESLAEEQRQAELSDVQKAQEQAKQFEDQLAELKSQVEAKDKAIRDQAIKNEFIKVASSANIIDIDAAMALSDLSAVEIGEDGKVNGVDDVIKTLVEHKPYLVAKKQKQPIGIATNGGGQQYHDKPAEQILEELRNKARKSGRIEDRVAYDKARKQYGK